MNVMIIGIVAEDELQRIQGQAISAMIIDSLHSREHKQDSCLADSHHRKRLSNHCSKRIQEEALEWMIVKRAIGVGYV